MGFQSNEGDALGGKIEHFAADIPPHAQKYFLPPKTIWAKIECFAADIPPSAQKSCLPPKNMWVLLPKNFLPPKNSAKQFKKYSEMMP